MRFQFKRLSCKKCTRCNEGCFFSYNNSDPTGIKVVATEEGVTLTGSDADISIESFIPVEEDGKEL